MGCDRLFYLLSTTNSLAGPLARYQNLESEAEPLPKLLSTKLP